MGDNPSLVDVVSVILKQSVKAECAAQIRNQKFEHELGETLKIARLNQADINSLKSKIGHSDQIVTGIQEKQSSLEARVNQIEFYVNKTFHLACENRQRNSKGNLILSGRHLPRYCDGENLLHITRDMIFRKYAIDINPAEFKTVHRLAGGRIFFSLHSRISGLGYDQLLRIINTNPNPGVEL